MIVGLPNQAESPKYTVDTFCMYIPKLKEWVGRKENSKLFKKFVDQCKTRFNYSYWLEEWEQAVSLGVAHYVITTCPEFSQSVGADAAAGGVMAQRSAADIQYSFDVDKYFGKNPAYLFWNTTGYGRMLCAMSLARGYVGMIITT